MNGKITHLKIILILLLSLCPMHLFCAAPEDNEKFIDHINFIVDIGVLNVRQSPDTTSKIISSLKKGRKLYVMGIEGNWLKISFNNRTGYVSRKYVRMDNVSKARTKIGTKTRTRTGRGKRAKGKKIQWPPSFMFIAKILPSDSLLTWAIIISLAVALFFLFRNFKSLDEKLLERLGSSKEAGMGWPMLTMAVAGILFAASMLGDDGHGLRFFTVLIKISTLLGIAAESIVRLGVKFAALRFLILGVICVITFFVAFFMTILLAFIIVVVIGLCLAGFMLSSMGRRRKVYYYYE